MGTALKWMMGAAFVAANAMGQGLAPSAPATPAPATPAPAAPSTAGIRSPLEEPPQVIPAAPDPDYLYRIGPDSMEQESVPKGQLHGPYVVASNVFPGTQHTFWIYVPAQYDPAKPASLMVFQDGHAYLNPQGSKRIQNVIDNLTFRREIPVMITVCINPGRRPDQQEAFGSQWGDGTTNRSVEYNELNDKYARVLNDEILPLVYKEYNISKDPERHAIGGESSGAIAAFTVAWQRPDMFRKVISTVGSFVNLRGGHQYPDIIRKSEKKPLRVFIQDGRNDNRGRAGSADTSRDWYFQAVQMVKALSEKGYDLNYTFGMNKHGGAFGGAILPDMMRWIWRDYDMETDPREAEKTFFAPKK